MVWKKKGARPVWHFVMVDWIEQGAGDPAGLVYDLHTGAVSASPQENHTVSAY